MSAGESRPSPDRQTYSTDRSGLFSYIRLGKRRSGQDHTSSPTLDHPTGHYVWDFLNWGFTTPHSLAEFSKLQPHEKDIVPYANMDQVSTLQLAYQRGLAALQRAQAKIERLSDENHGLQTMVKNWSIKTTALTTESIELRQEIASIKQRMKLSSVSIEDHSALISLICEKVCTLFDTNKAVPNAGLTFDELVKIVYSLPPLVQDKLAQHCPKFQQFVDSKDSGLFIRMQLSDAKITIQRILELLPVDMELTVLNSLVRDFETKQESSSELARYFETRTRRRSNTDPRDNRAALIRLPVSQQRDINYQLTLPDVRSDCYQAGWQHYSQEDLMSTDDTLDFGPSVSSVRPRNNSAGSYHESHDIEEVVPHTEVKVQCLASPTEAERSTSSSMGMPLAHSTPCGTMSKLVSTKYQVNPRPKPQPKKGKKKKISRWNFAARLCSSGKSVTISDSDSFDTPSNNQTSKAVYSRPLTK